MLLCLAVVNLGCKSDGDSPSGSSKSSSDPEKALIESRRAAWPATNGDFSDSVDLTAYTVLTLVPFENLTDNSKDDDAGTDLVEEIEDTLKDRYEDAFTTVRIADAPKSSPPALSTTSPRAGATATGPAAPGPSSRP